MSPVAAYEAVAYIPKPSLETIHSIARVMGVNTISVLGIDQITTNTDSPLVSYVVGLVVPAVIMVLFFLVWMCTLCCSRCCCKQRRAKRLCMLVFCLACSSSILAWILGLVGNSSATNGFNAVITGLEAVQGLAGGVVTISNDVDALGLTMQNLTTTMELACDNPYVAFPGAAIASQVNDAISQVSTSTAGLVQQLNDVDVQLSSVIVLVVPYLSWRETITLIILVLLLVIVSVFFISTFIRESQLAPRCLEKTTRLSSKTTSCVLFVFGILLMLLLWIVVAVVHVILTTGADICAPDVNANVNRLLSEVTTPNTPVAVGDNACLDPQFLSSQMGQILCYYQTCEGLNPLLGGQTIDITNGSVVAHEMVNNFEAEVRAQVPPSDIHEFEACFASAHEFANETDKFVALVETALGVVTCEQINPVYAVLLYNGFCNGLVDGLYFFYVSSILGMVFLMLAMSIYRTFDHPDEQQQGYVVSNDQQAPQAALAPSSGGPVTKEYA
ncbi:hypothetical protein BASA81_010600 [Batrachochytrium salamandrivorans]|nr:hypothetical protein BASA81_010600 [Batrachochytrium salamandrivorans]